MNPFRLAIRPWSYKPWEEDSKTSFSREVAEMEAIEKHAAY